MDLQTLLTVGLSSGGVMFLTLVFQAIKGFVDRKDKREEQALADRAKWLEQADDAREWAEKERNWWMSYAGTLEYLLNSHGVKLPERPEYPKREG